ncbi:MAG: radical SAM protein [Nitrospirae bacterium]|nr:MAG: radical SAM protein [Nitrospirota bacterium]
MTRHPYRVPYLVYANEKGEVFEENGLLMIGREGKNFRVPELEELIPLPEGSELFVLPGRAPLGIDPNTGEMVHLEGVQAVAAFVAPAHTATLWAAYKRVRDDAPVLPLFHYTAVGYLDGRFWAACFRSDPDPRQDASSFTGKPIKKLTLRALRANPENRLLKHLGNCCLRYGCPAARNYFLGRWEAPLPTSPVCNARCVGCISLQKDTGICAPQERISFVPTPEEICEIAVGHLKKAPRAVVSFGQGCEGEPLLQAQVIEDAIRRMRKETSRGTINLNTNASRPEAVESLARAGLDSIRVSLNSAQRQFYERYFRPRGYSFDDVLQSIRLAKKAGLFVSLNYFIFPGLTDTEEESTAFFDLIENLRPDMVQLRNLNIDPEYYLEKLDFYNDRPSYGILNWLKLLKKKFPFLRTGYFNPPVRQ